MLVDGENVRRSRWPNVPRERLEELVRTWVERQGVEARVIWEGRETADDGISREAQRLREKGHEIWVATSDRELRRRAEADRVIGGRTFLEEIRA